MRRICCLLLCLSLLLISAACRRGGGTEDGSDAAQLRIGALHTDLGSGADYVSYLENAARAYCQANEGVEIEVIDYGAVRDADALLRLNSELASGNGPDLLLLDGMPYERYARQGLLLDLNPYLDSGAGGLQRSELFAGPLRAMSYDDGLYCLSPRYTLRVNVGLRSLLGDAEIDFARLVELWNQRPESMVMLSAAMDNSALALLNTCLTGAQALGFLDKGAATCAFDDPRFLEILELCASLPQAAAREQTGEADMQFSSYLLLAEQQALFYPALISYPEQYIELLTGLNGDLRSFGEPGLGEDGVVCQLQLPLAITSAS